jgi:hypothetical protein
MRQSRRSFEFQEQAKSAVIMPASLSGGIHNFSMSPFPYFMKLRETFP